MRTERFWGALCLFATLVAAPATAEAATGNAKYYGGHVISHVQVVPVIWGTGVSADIVKGAEGFFTAIVNSPYLDWLGEYDTVGLKGAADGMPGSNQHINRGTVLPLVTIVPQNTSKSISDNDTQAELLAQLAAGKLPAPHVDREGGVDTVYVIAFPKSVKVSDFGGQDACSLACAYHWTVTVPGIASGVPYAVIPDCSGNSQNFCSLGTGVFDTYTGDAAHELVEAMTDPECGLDNSTDATRPLGWFDPAQANQEGEIADICLSDGSAFVQYNGYVVQANWSQRLGKCITNDPNLGLCDGKTRPCRPCAASDCSGATPTCETDMASDKWGQCVTASSSSSGGEPDAGDGDHSGSSSSSGGSSSGGSSSGGASSSGSAADGKDEGTSSGARASGCGLAPAGAPSGWAACVGLLAALALGRRRRH